MPTATLAKGWSPDPASPSQNAVLLKKASKKVVISIFALLFQDPHLWAKEPLPKINGLLDCSANTKRQPKIPWKTGPRE
jgi:hypothetical protein